MAEEAVLVPFPGAVEVEASALAGPGAPAAGTEVAAQWPAGIAGRVEVPPVAAVVVAPSVAGTADMQVGPPSGAAGARPAWAEALQAAAEAATVAGPVAGMSVAAQRAAAAGKAASVPRAVGLPQAVPWAQAQRPRSAGSSSCTCSNRRSL